MRAAADADVDRSSSGVNLMLICLHSSVAVKGAHTGERIDRALLEALRRVLNE